MSLNDANTATGNEDCPAFIAVRKNDDVDGDILPLLL